MKIRSNAPELMDLGPKFYTQKEYEDCLYQLGRIGKYLGTDSTMIKIFANLPFNFDSILDVGCGGGSFAIQLAQTFAHASILGTDISHDAINYAQKQTNKNLNNLKFELRNSEFNEPEKSIDIITSTLVFHHLTDESIVEFLKHASSIAKKAIIINDLHRHWLAYAGCSFIIPIFFANRLVKYDSLLSIKKAFTRDELECYLIKAGFSQKNFTISWHWPFRWIVRIML